MLKGTFTITIQFFPYQDLYLIIESKFNRQNITYTTFRSLIISNKIVKISEYNRIAGIDYIFLFHGL